MASQVAALALIAATANARPLSPHLTPHYSFKDLYYEVDGIYVGIHEYHFRTM